MALKNKTVNLTGKKLVQKALVINKNRKVAEAKKAEVVEVKAPVNEVMKEVVKEDKKYELTIGLKDLLEAGSHLGHKVSKTHPKAKENIYMAKDGIQIVDLVKTQAALERACNFIYNARRNGKKVVLLGTKRQAREVIKRVALDAGVPYITDR